VAWRGVAWRSVAWHAVRRVDRIRATASGAVAANPPVGTREERERGGGKGWMLEEDRKGAENERRSLEEVDTASRAVQVRRRRRDERGRDRFPRGMRPGGFSGVQPNGRGTDEEKVREGGMRARIKKKESIGIPRYGNARKDAGRAGETRGKRSGKTGRVIKG